MGLAQRHCRSSPPLLGEGGCGRMGGGGMSRPQDTLEKESSHQPAVILIHSAKQTQTLFLGVQAQASLLYPQAIYFANYNVSMDQYIHTHIYTYNVSMDLYIYISMLTSHIYISRLTL